jgi:hypothetical protein
MAPLPELPVNDKALHFFGVNNPSRGVREICADAD